MEISWWRDLVIIIWGAVGTVILVIITIIVWLLYKRVNRLVDSADSIIARTSDLIDFAEEEVLQPAAQFESFIQGIIRGARFISDLFRKKEDKKSE